MEAKLRESERQMRQEKDQLSQLMNDKRSKNQQLDQVTKSHAMNAMQEVADLESELQKK